MIYSIYNKQSLKIAADLINNGEIIVYPTDTLYGFGVNALNTNAIQKLNRLKGRVQPLSIILDSIKQIYKYANIDNSIEDEITKIFPGKYTALLPAIENDLSHLVQNGSTKVGIRIPNHFFPIKLVAPGTTPEQL